MRRAVAIVIGGAAGFGLIMSLGFLIDLLMSSIGSYTFLVAGIVAGVVVGAAIGAFSRTLGTIVGLVVVILLSLAGTALELEDLAYLVIGIAIAPFSYLIAGFIAGAISGVKGEYGFNWRYGALTGVLASILAVIPIILVLPPINLQLPPVIMDSLEAGGVFTHIALLTLAALVLGAFGGAIGGQLAGARV